MVDVMRFGEVVVSKRAPRMDYAEEVVLRRQLANSLSVNQLFVLIECSLTTCTYMNIV